MTIFLLNLLRKINKKLVLHNYFLFLLRLKYFDGVKGYKNS